MKRRALLAFALAGILIAGIDECLAQDAAELGNLIFSQVLPATAEDDPLPIESGSGGDTAAQSSLIDAQVAAVERLRETRRPDAEIIEQLGSLAVSYQNLDRHEDALSALEDAISIARREYGRNSFEQVPLIEQQIPSYFALGDADSIEAAERRVYELKARHFAPGSREIFAATVDLANWLTSAYFRENFSPSSKLEPGRADTGRRPPACAPGRYPRRTSITNCAMLELYQRTAERRGADTDFEVQIDPFSRVGFGFRYAHQSRLLEIETLLMDFQQDWLEVESHELDVAIDLSKRMAQLAYVMRQAIEFDLASVADPERETARIREAAAGLIYSYDGGESALRYVIELLGEDTVLPPQALAAAWLDLGDWRLAFGRMPEAEEAYGRAYQVLIDAGFSSGDINVALATVLPTRIPVFATHLYTRSSIGLADDAELNFRGYLDVNFSVDVDGNVNDLRIVGASTDSAANVEKLLELELESAKFRPALIDGRLSPLDRIEARYLYAY